MYTYLRTEEVILSLRKNTQNKDALFIGMEEVLVKTYNQRCCIGLNLTHVLSSYSNMKCFRYF
jgi:AMMECR1 domain-containing protein